MLRLLSADFSRLFKNRLFYMLIAAMFAFGVLIPVAHYVGNVNDSYGWSSDSGFFTYIAVLPIVSSLLTALFVGCGYSDGTLRNKVVVGHGRVSIYLSNMVVCIVAASLLAIAYIVPFFTLGSMLLEASTVSLAVLGALVLVGFALTCAFVAVFTLVSMLCGSKAYSVAICILIAFALLFAGVAINSALNEPEFYDAYSVTTNGETYTEEASRNPNYLSGTKRKVYEFMYDFVPGGQSVQLVSMTASHLWILALYDLVIVVASTWAGVALFSRKDLK